MRYLFTVIAFLALTAPALAIPGQTQEQFLKWAHSNPAVVKLQKDAVSPSPIGCKGPCRHVYTAEMLVGKMRLSFEASFAKDIEWDEDLLAAAPLGAARYDWHQHRDVLQAVVQLVYGRAIAGDMKNAVNLFDKPACPGGFRLTILRGKYFAYDILADGFFVYPLSFIHELLKPGCEEP